MDGHTLRQRRHCAILKNPDRVIGHIAPSNFDDFVVSVHGAAALREGNHLKARHGGR
jgi:hypothetical protein